MPAERPRCSPRRPTEPGLVGDGRRRNAGSELTAGGSLRRNSALTGRGGYRAGAARPLAEACRDALSRGRLDAAGRAIGPLREAGVADGTGIARSEHRVSFSM